MWKVKRMTPARIAALGIAVVAGGIAAYLASGSDDKPAPQKNADNKNAPDIVHSEIILTNVRVLAIDQAPKEQEGKNAVVGKTVTLELKPEQAETLARARQIGTLSLALRSIADVNMVENLDEDAQQRSRRGESVNVIRYGVVNPTTMQK